MQFNIFSIKYYVLFFLFFQMCKQIFENNVPKF